MCRKFTDDDSESEQESNTQPAGYYEEQEAIRQRLYLYACATVSQANYNHNVDTVVMEINAVNEKCHYSTKTLRQFSKDIGRNNNIGNVNTAPITNCWFSYLQFQES